MYAFDDGEFALNTLTTASQTNPKLAALPGGGFIATWVSTDPAQDGDGNAIKAQIYDASGQPVGSEFLVNQLGTGSQFNNAVTVLADGTIVISWITNDTTQDGSGNAVKARMFAADGTPLGDEFLVNTQTTGSQYDSQITALANGGFVISWDDWSTSDQKAQVFDASGAPVGGEITTNTLTAGSQGYGDIEALEGGGFVAVWRSDSTSGDGSSYGVKGQVFADDGTKLGSEFLVNSETANAQYEASVASMAGGGFVVVWTTYDTTQDGSFSAIKGQVFDASGATVGSEFLVNQEGYEGQTAPVVTGTADGGFFVSWYTRDPAQDGDAGAIKARAYDAGGQPVQDEFLVNTYTAGAQSLPEAIRLEDGTIMVAWATAEPGDAWNYDLRAQFFSASNQAPLFTSFAGAADVALSTDENTGLDWQVSAVDGDGDALSYTLSGADAALFAFDAQTGTIGLVATPDFEAPADADGDNVYEVSVTASDGSDSATQNFSVSVTNVVDGITVTGTRWSDTLSGSVAEDAIYGLQGADILSGGGGADYIDGDSGHDVLIGGGGADILVGGGGRDTFVFEQAGDSTAAAYDSVVDFEAGRDTLDFSAIDADASAAGDQAFSYIGGAQFSSTAGEMRAYATIDGVFVEGDIDGDGIADISVLLQNAASIDAGSFVL